MSSFNMTSSKVLPEDKQRLNIERLIQECQRQGIALQKMSKQKLQWAYGMLGFSALNINTSSVCFIFISTIDNNGFAIYGFINGQKLIDTIIGEENLAFMIAEALQKARDHPQKTTEDDDKMIRSYFETLRAKSDKVAKKAVNEMQAIQQIKSSNQYIQICNQIKVFSLEVQQLCQTIKARKRKAEKKNAKLLDQFISVQKQKAQISKALLEYDVMKEQTNKIPQKLDKFIQQQKNVVELNDFHDEDSFNNYLGELINLKKLENQKKFVNF